MRGRTWVEFEAGAPLCEGQVSTVVCVTALQEGTDAVLVALQGRGHGQQLQHGHKATTTGNIGTDTELQPQMNIGTDTKLQPQITLVLTQSYNHTLHWY